MNEKVKGEWRERRRQQWDETHTGIQLPQSWIINLQTQIRRLCLIHTIIFARTYTHTNPRQENHIRKKAHTYQVPYHANNMCVWLCVCVRERERPGAWVHYYLLQLLFYYKRKCGSHLASTPHRDNNNDGIITTMAIVIIVVALQRLTERATIQPPSPSRPPPSPATMREKETLMCWK